VNRPALRLERATRNSNSGPFGFPSSGLVRNARTILLTSQVWAELMPRALDLRRRELLERHAILSPPAGQAGAAVLIALRRGTEAGFPEVLLIERAQRPGDPGAGQIGLPGGHVSPGDSTLCDTALRETDEEVGLSRSDFEGVPVFVSIEPARAFGLAVGVFAVAVRDGASEARAKDPAEVASVFWMPIERVRSSEPVERATPVGLRVVEATRIGEHVLWGFTRSVLRKFSGAEPKA
jgi:8-oxo-dGTP pyrophosphatase MutT (NUDIX family)